MRERSLGITALAVTAVMVGIYAFMAAIALLMGGSIVSLAGGEVGAMVFALGALFLGQSLAAYVVAFGLWMQKSWAWAGGVVIFATIVVLNVALSAMAANFISVVLPLVGAGVALVYLYRPATKAALLGEPAPEGTGQPVLSGVAKTSV